MALIKQYTCKFKLIRTLIYNSSCTIVLSKIEHNLCLGKWRDRQTREKVTNEPSDRKKFCPFNIRRNGILLSLLHNIVLSPSHKEKPYNIKKNPQRKILSLSSLCWLCSSLLPSSQNK
jgi:hypothetical protein